MQLFAKSYGGQLHRPELTQHGIWQARHSSLIPPVVLPVNDATSSVVSAAYMA